MYIKKIKSCEKMATPSATSVFFTKLSKYSGDIKEDLSTFVREFNRCAVIANKNNDAVKGQYLMLCVAGRAKAVLENYEAEQVDQLGFDVLVAKLKAIFDNTASREAKMSMFETRIQQIAESEEEFMLDLVKMYRNSNPTADAVALSAAVKRKFLQGISPDLKRNLFIFCSNPYDNAVTRDDVLEASRKAQDLLKVDTTQNKSSICMASNESSGATADIISTINNLSLQIEEKLQKQSERIDSIAHDFGRNASRFQSRSYRDTNFRGRGRGRGRNTSQNAEIVCYKCGQKNHYAKHCLSKSGNSGN